MCCVVASLLCGVIILNRLIMKIDNTLLDVLTALALLSVAAGDECRVQFSKLSIGDYSIESI